MSHQAYFRILKTYANLWSRRNCKVIMAGEENIDTGRPRIYIVSHPTTWDLPLLSHISKKHFYIVVAEGPFANPLVKWMFDHTGFFELKKENSAETIEKACSVVRDGHPLIYSLKGYGVDFGEDVRPRTGGVRIAHMAGADIIPTHLTIEEGKRYFKYYNKSETESYPYTLFRDTLYHVTFLPAIRYEDYAKPEMTYEEYKTLAYSIEDKFIENQKRIDEKMQAEPEYYKNIKRTGGSPKQVIL